MKPIFCSLDLNKESLTDVLDAFTDIKTSGFDGVELCLWEDMRDYAKTIRKGLERNSLSVNIHGDLLRSSYGIEKCIEIFDYSLQFAESIGAQKIITHPIKPYDINKHISQELFKQFNKPFLIENVKGITFEDITNFSKHAVLDIGNAYMNDDYPTAEQIKLVDWLHIHDYTPESDHLAFGKGMLDLDKILSKFDLGITIELGKTFRKWSQHKNDHKIFIDAIKNGLIKRDSYGKNIRLMHLKKAINNSYFDTAVELGCGEGYLLHNVSASSKYGLDINPRKSFNDIQYQAIDLNNTSTIPSSNLVICSEVIEHLITDEKLLRQIYKSLKNKGILFLTTINANTLEDKSEKDKERGHLRRYDTTLKNSLERLGFKTKTFYPMRSKYYYQNKPHVNNYNIDDDAREGLIYASGLVYVGVK